MLSGNQLLYQGGQPNNNLDGLFNLFLAKMGSVYSWVHLLGEFSRDLMKHQPRDPN